MNANTMKEACDLGMEYSKLNLQRDGEKCL
jgi:hypothetical protein